MNPDLISSLKSILIEYCRNSQILDSEQQNAFVESETDSFKNMIVDDVMSNGSMNVENLFLTETLEKSELLLKIQKHLEHVLNSRFHVANADQHAQSLLELTTDHLRTGFRQGQFENSVNGIAQYLGLPGSVLKMFNSGLGRKAGKFLKTFKRK